MTSQARSSQRDEEAQFIERLRTRYEDEGFTFTAHPDAAQLPDFLGSYVPDALARKPGRNVVIEVKRRQAPSAEHALEHIRQLFEGHSDWRFHVVFRGGDPFESVSISPSAPETVLNRMNEVRALIAEGYRRPAFIMAWSLLESALQAQVDQSASRPRAPGALVQTLAMNGYIGPDMERRMRSLIDLRNRLVHGDLIVEPEMADIELVLSAIEETLSAHAS